MSAEQPTPVHPFYQALETWEAWSMADTMRSALGQARAQHDRASLAEFERHPDWTHGPGPLEALRANRELVDRLTGWRWLALRHARENGHPWAEIGAVLGVTGEQARQDYLDRLERHRQVVEHDPSLARLIGSDPGLADLAEPTQADRDQQDREAGRDR
jgi:hypothetical protein